MSLLTGQYLNTSSVGDNNVSFTGTTPVFPIGNEGHVLISTSTGTSTGTVQAVYIYDETAASWILISTPLTGVPITGIGPSTVTYPTATTSQITIPYVQNGVTQNLTIPLTFPAPTPNTDFVQYATNNTIPTVPPVNGVETIVLLNKDRYDWNGTAWVLVEYGSIVSGGQTFTFPLAGGVLATQATTVPVTRLINTTTPLTGGGSLANDLTLGINLANTTTTGALTSTDWNTFNNKWDPNGNTITAGQYLGTNNAQDLVFKANNIEIGRYAVGTIGWDFGFNSTATGAHAVNFGQNGIASNLNSFNTGLNGTASGQYSFNTGAGGRATASYSVNTAAGGLASAFYSFNSGLSGTASGLYSFNAARNGVASNSDAVNFGLNGTASGNASFNSGANGTASGLYSFNSGASGTASGFRAINLAFSSGVGGQSAFNSGAESTVSGNYGISLGRQGNVSGLNGFNSGQQGRADGDYSFNTAYTGTAASYGEHSLGLFPVPYTPSSATSWVATDRLFNIGNGFISNPSNAFTILKNGNTFILGKISQFTTGNSPKGTATLVNGVVTISNTLATTGCFITVNYRTGVAQTVTTSILKVNTVVNATSFTVTAYTPGTLTTNTLDNNQIEYTISN